MEMEATNDAYFKQCPQFDAKRMVFHIRQSHDTKNMCMFKSIQYFGPNWPRYCLRGLHIRLTWFSLYGTRVPLFSLYGIRIPLFSL